MEKVNTSPLPLFEAPPERRLSEGGCALYWRTRGQYATHAGVMCWLVQCLHPGRCSKADICLAVPPRT